MIRRQDIARNKQKKWENFSDVLFFIMLAFIVVVQFLFFRPTLVSGESMMPTLADKEMVTTARVGEVKRFDIVTFLPQEGEKHYIKRVIGMPGETIYYQNDQLFINGLPVDEPYLETAKAQLKEGEQLTADFYYGDGGYLYTIPDNHYFVLGDNRQNSKDSRRIGPIEKDGTLRIMNYRLWPFDRFGAVD